MRGALTFLPPMKSADSVQVITYINLIPQSNISHIYMAYN